MFLASWGDDTEFNYAAKKFLHTVSASDWDFTEVPPFIIVSQKNNYLYVLYTEITIITPESSKRGILIVQSVCTGAYNSDIKFTHVIYIKIMVLLTVIFTLPYG